MEPKPERVETPVAGLPAIKRHIATHNAAGTSIYAASPPAQQYIQIPGTGGMARSWSVGSVPARLEGDADMKAYLAEEGVTSWTSPAIVTPNGANILVVDLEPGGVSNMHRTVSIDFSICVIGEIEHELDGGEKVLLKPGVSRCLISCCVVSFFSLFEESASQVEDCYHISCVWISTSVSSALKTNDCCVISSGSYHPARNEPQVAQCLNDETCPLHWCDFILHAL